MDLQQPSLEKTLNLERKLIKELTIPLQKKSTKEVINNIQWRFQKKLR